MSDKQIQARYEALLSATADVVMIVTKKGTVSVCTAGTETWIDAAACKGNKIENIFPDELGKAINSSLSKAGVNEKAVTSTIQIKQDQIPVLYAKKLKENQWFELRAVQADNEYILVFRNISARRRLERQVSSQAQRDPLTGAYNRRALRPVLEQAVAQAQRYDWVCSLMLIDVDNFSDLNDKYSWDCGDQILQQLVTSVHGMKRTSDFLARYSDDQFVMFMPETNHEQGIAAGERVRKLMEGMEIPSASGNANFTVSIGVAVLNDTEDNGENMLRRASENLYIAKQSGGNRVEGED